jgi:hypothetical protein
MENIKIKGMFLGDDPHGFGIGGQIFTKGISKEVEIAEDVFKNVIATAEAGMFNLESHNYFEVLENKGREAEVDIAKMLKHFEEHASEIFGIPKEFITGPVEESSTDKNAETVEIPESPQVVPEGAEVTPAENGEEPSSEEGEAVEESSTEENGTEGATTKRGRKAKNADQQ